LFVSRRMAKVSPILKQATLGDAEKESNALENRATKVLMWLSLVDLVFTVFPYGMQIYPTLFLSGKDLVATPITYFCSVLAIVKPSMNFLVYWKLILSFREVIQNMFSKSVSSGWIVSGFNVYCLIILKIIF